ncbi:olfactory receptor 14C36-like [Protobothrops mucrosquamatus]|uniref:olfactory receptor 14C36-like n=1 Tax=Protobothrops mucrosquamatus TaxID=103944 RepID=UPI0010FB5BA0|nr:olfactory receptor 14C36-like [Protobothrops mucrosquamatus]
MNNDTFEFLLWEFSKIWELQVMHVALLLILYLMTVTWNVLIISAVVCDHHLHTPMYFFLMNLAMQDIGSVSVIIPKTLFNFLTNIRSISHSGCIAQVMFLLFFLSCDTSLLTVMAYDRYIAICNPLHYEMIINRKACTKIIAGVWTASLLNASLHTVFTFMTPFCSNSINQFFCEIPYLLKIACSDLYVSETRYQIFIAMLSTGCFVFVIVTYMHVFSAVLRIPSVLGRKKAFSTCLPHLFVFFIFFFTSCLAYLKPTADSESHANFIITIMYSIIPSMLNPLIYSMRNKDIKVALSRVFGKKILFF